VRAFKEGLLSAFAHDHTVRAPVAGGFIDRSGDPGVEIRFDARALEVVDQELSPKKRGAVRETMLGPEVLDAARYPEIVFRSRSATHHESGPWSVEGLLTLHGKTRPIRIEAAEEGDRFRGSVLLRQTDFGITPVRVAGGTVRVKDEIRVEFDVVASAP
jgi:hypothetical protein